MHCLNMRTGERARAVPAYHLSPRRVSRPPRLSAVQPKRTVSGNRYRNRKMTMSAETPAALAPDALDAAIGSLWQAWRDGIYFPPVWHDRLCAEDGYRISLAIARYR